MVEFGRPNHTLPSKNQVLLIYVLKLKYRKSVATVMNTTTS